ncbi:MAG: 16S rRNA processing protein RimM [Micavibrio aeruginosavorus]|uniref:Ribosome maturation factor RimM n=1 Tax=Micavibrio aeruginosavorus TaxID=349221 RepID=A0A2W5Q2W4_9BACT|nr:MAG: 16S rRNA processing protein RimM [Micavibrio aeruginosavorus]
MTDSKRILIGEIATAHGIKGYVKVRPFVDDETLLERDGVFTSETENKTIKIKLKNALKGDFVAQVDGISDRNAAELLRGTQLYIDRDTLPDTDDGEYYIEDLKGLRVIDKDGSTIGDVISVENFGASDLLDIKPVSGASFYIPFTDDTIIDVDFESGVVTVEMPEILE